MKKFLLGLGVSLCVISGANAITSLSKTEIKTGTDQGYILGDNYKSYEECTGLKDKYNKEYPNYKRSECFSDGVGYKYFICQANDACTLPGGTTLQTTTSLTNTPTTIKNTTTNVPNQKQLDAFLKQLSGKQSTLSGEKYEALLKSVGNKFAILEKKYAKNATVLQMVNYLSNGVEELKVQYAQSGENDDIANFFKDLEEGNTEEVSEIASKEATSSNTTTTTKNPTSSSSSGGSSSTTGTKTGAVTVTTPTPVQEVLPGWSKVDGPKSKYPNTEDELKFICKAGYRLPTNAEWNALRLAGAGDLFTKEAQKLGLSSAYYWTKEGDIFYVMNGESGYLNPVKAEDSERIKNIPHYIRCISNEGAGTTTQANPVPQILGTDINPDLKNLSSLVGKKLGETKFVDAIVEKYISSNYYFEIKQEAKEIEQKTVSYTITKVVDHGTKPPVNTNAPSRLLTWWYGFGPTQQSMNDSIERYVRDLNTYMSNFKADKPDTTQYALSLYNSRENAKQYMYIVAQGACPEGSEMYATTQFLNGAGTSKERQNICKVKGEEKYFTVYFNTFPAPEKITQKYSGIQSVREYDTTLNPVCADTKEITVFGKKVTGTFQNAEITFQAEMNIGASKKERLEKPWTSSSFSFVTRDVTKLGECFATPNGGIMKENDVGFRSMSPYEIEYGICPGIVVKKDYGQASFSPAYRLGGVKEISCNYNYTVNP